MIIKNKYGYLTYNKIGSNEYCINNLFIKPIYRRKGKVTRLLKQVIDRLHGSIILIVCSNAYGSNYERLKRFYIKHGFKIQGNECKQLKEHIAIGIKECLMKLKTN